MKKNAYKFLMTVILIGISGLMAQNTSDPVLLNVAGESITKSEFLNVYKKNNVKGEAMDRKSLEEYLDLYINFKLKVKEAEELGLDTAISFKTELAGYRKQLAQPYLTDKQVDESLLREAYERMQEDLRASHILIKLDKNATPEDTLAAYKKIMKLRERIMKGEAFEKIAKEASEDPSSRDREDPTNKQVVKGNGGDLGFFTVLDMIYPFETGAYNLHVGEVSMPVRTDYGYHLIKLTDRKPAMGKVQVAHIFITVPKDAKPEDTAGYKSKILEVYAKIKNGSSFEDMVTQYSDDKGSATKGGILPAFGVNRMVPEFIVAIQKLKDIGAISEPVRTDYGWHIIKLVDRKPIKSFDDEKSILKSRIMKDSRASMSKGAVINRIKNEYKFMEFAGTKNDFYTVLDTTVFDGKWDIQKAQTLNKNMFSLASKNYTQQDLAKYIATHQNKRAKTGFPTFVNEKYNAFVDESCINYEDGRLETKYPEFRALMKEYRDGILLFELTDQKVWSKAIKDTSGLEEFHAKNKNNYMWDTRLDASIYTCKDAATAKAARKLAKSQEKKKLSDSDILKKINTDSIPVLKIESKYFLKKDNALIDSIKWEKSITSDINKGKSVVFVSVHKVMAPEPKTLKEAKGLVTADYQNYLEKEWIDALRNKYKWDVNKEVFESLLK
ncbi:MAG: peptidylprolyl isomerase [Bacteroidota bacterium]